MFASPPPTCTNSSQAINRKLCILTFLGLMRRGWNFDQMTQVYWSMPDLWLNAYETEIEAGACTSLDWKAENAVAVTLDGEPVANEGQIRVCPAETRSYLLSADIGCTSEQRTVTVRVRYPVPQVEYAIWGFDGVDIDESEIQIYVSYSYETNNTEPIYISARVLGYGQILDYFYIDPVKIYPGSDQVNMSLIYGYNDPPDVILSDQIEIYMFWGTEELHSERFDYQKRWKSFIVK